MTASQPTPNAQFSALLSRFAPGIVALAKRCLLRLRRAFPGANQLVYDYSNSLVVSFGMSERGYEAIAAVAIFPRWVRLYFDKSVPDPKGLLEGSGGKVRSVTLKSAAELERADVQALIDAAVKHAGITAPPKRSTRTIIKSAPKKSASARAGRKSR